MATILGHSRPPCTGLCSTQLNTLALIMFVFLIHRLCFHYGTSGMTGALCLWQVTKTMNGQSSGCMRTPAAWAQVGWNAVEQRPWEHWTQQPVTSLFIRFLQYAHFCQGDKDRNVDGEQGSGGEFMRGRLKLSMYRGRKGGERKRAKQGKRSKKVIKGNMRQADPDTNWNTDMSEGNYTTSSGLFNGVLTSSVLI